MTITHGNRSKEWLIKLFQLLINRLDNTGVSDGARSGEANFIKNVCDHYENQTFTFFDVGANNGDYTDQILAARKSGSTAIHLFEPQSTCSQLLRQKYSTKNNIKITPLGLSDTPATVTLYKDKDQSELASIFKRNLDHYRIPTDTTESIQLTTGEKYVEENKISKINLLKIDVEGNEYNVLKGFGSFLHPDRIDFIQFEYGGASLDSHTSLMELHRFLTEKGFIVCKLMKNSLEIRPYHPRLENFMYQNWVAISPVIAPKA